MGKELFARAIHDNSPRAAAPFVAVDCASLPRSLAGSILFGHRKGAFTGADSNRDGLVLQADGGTLFLDEVGELPLSMQKMFLRVLQEHRFRPVGGRTEITSDFRLIAATNRDLEDMAERNTFRSDLLYRMRTVVVSIPPLRERCEDVTALAGHYLPRIWARFALPEKDISPDFHETLLAYHWPGNVRELIHTLERAVLASQDAPKLFARHLPDYLRICLARTAARNGVAATDGHGGPGGPSCLYGIGERAVLAEASPEGGPAAASAEPAALAASVEALQRGNAAHRKADGPHPARDRTGVTATPARSASPVSPGWGPRAPYAIYTSPHYAPPPEPTHAGPSIGGAEPVPQPAMQAFHSGPGSREAAPFPGELPRFFDFRDAQFTTYLRELMRRAGGDIRAACGLSGLSRSHLYDLLRKHGIPPR